MKKKVWGILGILLVFLAVRADDFYPRNRGIDVLHYHFQVSLTGKGKNIRVRAELKIRLENPTIKRISLDLKGDQMRVEAVEMNRQPLTFQRQTGKIWIDLPPDHQSLGVDLNVNISGVPFGGLIVRPNKYGTETYLADHWPDQASGWLPCNDHPSDKATCEFLVTAPARYQVVATGILRETRDLPGGFRLTHWREEAPVATKVMMIAVSRFAVQYQLTDTGIPVQTWVYTEDRQPGFQAFQVVPEVLNFFTRLIGPYSYAKIASVQGPTLYGGLENAGAVTYHERALENPPLVNLIAHEMAHQWFGDSVTEASWDHVWLSEGFATYFTTLFQEFARNPRELPRRMAAARDRVIRFYRRHPDRSVVDPGLTDIHQILSANTYQKGAWVLHMLRVKLGDETFFKGIRRYYRLYQNRNAWTRDFQKAMEAVSEEDLGDFFRQWIFSPGIPELSGDWRFDSRRERLRIRLDQRQSAGTVFDFPLEIALYFPDRPVPDIRELYIRERRNRLVLPCPRSPVRVELDPNVRVLMIADFKN